MGDTNSSFYGDTPNYATDYPTQNDSNTEPVNGNSPAPSSFYPDGGTYQTSDPDVAANYAAQAAASAAAAAASDADAQDQAAIATTQAANASASATAAAGSASSASTSATSASGSASSASISATNAGNSATAASGSASTAATSATNAANSATAASGSASAASTSAGNAATSATNAANSATAAATSAANAASAVQAAAGTATPLVDGTAAVGTSTKWAHEDHKHPTDTTRAPTSNPSFTGAVGVNQTTPLAPVHVGNGNTVGAAVDCQVVISRAVDNGKTGNGHAFADASVITRSGGIGYNSYDVEITYSGSVNYNHYAGFQNAPQFSMTGTVDNIYGLFDAPTVNTGATATTRYGAKVVDVGGSGTVGTQYGFYVDTLTRATTNYAFYSNGTAPSQFGGDVTWGGAGMIAFTPTQTGTATGTAAGAYKQFGKMLFIALKFTCTASGSIILSMPAGLVANGLDFQTINGFEGQVSGDAQIGIIAGGAATVTVQKVTAYGSAHPTGVYYLNGVIYLA